MPIFNVLKPDPWTRVNDAFVFNGAVDASPISDPVRPDIIDSGPNTCYTLYQADWYKHIACDVVVESVFDYPYPYITEKTLRPMSCKRMFLIIGPVGILSLLRDKGFQTFDDIIDESYDSIQDPVQRFQAVITEARQICSRPLSDIVQYLELNQCKLEHNFQNLMDLHDRELLELKAVLK